MTLEVFGLRARLRDIVKPQAPSAAALPAPPAPEPVPPSVLLGGHEHGDGRFVIVEKRSDRAAPYGRVPVGEIGAGLAACAAQTSLLLNGPAVEPPFVFFDLETTGLSGGAGTYAFLVGLGWFDSDGTFLSRQYLLTRHDGERPMLEAVAAELARAGALVSFNGKSFDSPVLEMRDPFHRLAFPGRLLPHLDVLHPARAFWGSTSGRECSLIALEHRLLGARRLGDVPGWEIPSRYFQFVRTGDAAHLEQVLEHNRLDLLSLAGISAHLLRLLEEGSAGARDARESLALGRIYARAGLERETRDAFQRAEQMASVHQQDDVEHQAIRIEALRHRARLERRTRRHDAAARCWQAVLGEPECPANVAREASEALAVHHEHRVRDLEAARAFALRTLIPGARAGGDDAVRHRLARIERKMNASGRPPTASLPWPPASGSRSSGRRTSW